jgi:Na+-driven multidrug efflux pump
MGETDMAWSERKTGYRKGRYFNQMGLALLVLVFLIALPLAFLPEDLLKFYLSEGGPIEVFTAAGYLIVVATLVREMPYRELLKRWHLVAIPIAMCLRELDFHAHFTTHNITKTTLYISPDVPLWEKLIGATVVIALAVAFYRLLKGGLRSFVHGLRHGEATAVAIAAAIGCAVLSKAIDGAPSNLTFLGIHLARIDTSTVFEEILELGIPIFLAIAAFAAFPTQEGLAKRAAGQVAPNKPRSVT